MSGGITRKQAEATIARLTGDERALLKSLPDNERLILFELMAELDATLVTDPELAAHITEAFPPAQEQPF